MYESIVFNLINKSNVKDGIERMPPKEKTKQAEKNSINCYVIIINIYRLMGFESIWLIVLAKTCRLLDFVFKRKTDLTSFKDL
jgi:hypothetical protein